MKEKNIAAFFDIDGTIYREGLITEVFKKIIKYELVDETKWYKDVRPSFIKWDKRQGGYDEYLLKMVDIYTEAIRGISNHHIEYIAKKVIEQKGDRVYTFTRERIKWHKEQGHIVIAIYKLDHNNTYNGDIIPMWDSESKEKAILELKEKHNIDLENSYAYGDTSGDFTMFKNVGIPYAINPTRELITKVLQCDEIKEKIKVIVERKDVTYDLDINNLKLL